MLCAEMLELEANYNRYNDLSIITTTLLSTGRGEFSKWHRSGPGPPGDDHTDAPANL